ncbi:hypothetical protein [Novosphingobium sp.]|uniref:hypothetical protein n=1 Tax=Novosphingobium sp. TaxID=1874826 RepID=UPI00263282CF|nr:hypothetical protein [Novosphingobium sp.]
MATAFSPRHLLPLPGDLISPEERRELEAFVAAAIDLLDLLDGDVDLEDDDPQGACDEDEISTMLGGWHSVPYARLRFGPGCELPEEGL